MVLAARFYLLGEGLKNTSTHCTEAATAIPKWNIKAGANFLVCELGSPPVVDKE